ncbi:MAG: hypothetical protein H7839_07070 [Magnetococcus sp. YQC-5]
MKKHFVAALLWVLVLSFGSSVGAMEPTEQPPFNKTEMDKFLTDYPEFTEWLTKQNAHVDTKRNPWIMAGMRFDKAFTARLKEKQWDPDRFFYLLNHINTGLLLTASEKLQSEAQARMAQEQQANNAQMQKNQQQMQQEMADANQRARDQLAARQEQIRLNPNIPPFEKQRMLAQMNRNASTFTAPNPQEAAQQRQSQQANWFNTQEQYIRSNPNMHPMQRQQALAQLQQARLSQQQAAKPAPFPSQEEMRNETITQYNKWFDNQKRAVETNPRIPPAQKKQMLEQLQTSAKQFKESMEPKPAPSIIPPEEKALVEANQKRLMELLFIKP